MPTISLIIGTYNRGPKIGSTIESALNQTRPADEIIVVDDCSTDGTGDWVREHFPTVRVIRPAQNGGTSRSRNFGAQHARGELLAFLDHDDELLPCALEVLERNLCKWPSARASFANHGYRNLDTGVVHDNNHQAFAQFHRLRDVRTVANDGEIRLFDRALHDAMLHGNLLQQPWMIYRSTFLELGGFPPDIWFCEDWDLYLRVTKRHHVVLTDDVISYHVMYGGNLSFVPGGDEMHVAVILRSLATTGIREWSNYWVLRRRLGMYYKTFGDRAVAQSKWRAWCYYLSSAAAWPLDYVVAVRSLLWFPSAMGHRVGAPLVVQQYSDSSPGN